MILHYLKTAFRQLTKHRSRTIISILGLIAGMVCFCISSYFMRVSYRGDSCFPTYERMAGLFSHTDGFPDIDDGTYKYRRAYGESVRQFLQMDFDGIEAVAGYGSCEYANLELSQSDSLTSYYRGTVVEASEDFFKVYPIDVREGNVQSFAARPHTAVITRSFARRLGTGESPIGKTLTLKTFQNRRVEGELQIYTIVGVVEDIPLWTNIAYHVNVDVFLHQDISRFNSPHVSILLKPGVDVQHLNRRLQHLKFGENKKEWLDVQLYSSVRILNPSGKIITIFGLLVLLTGVINFLTFTLGSFLNRIRELSLRKVVGAGTWHLFLLLATELVIMLFITALGSMVVLEIASSTILSMMFGADVTGASGVYELMIHAGEYCTILFLICVICAYITIWRTQCKVTLTGIKGGASSGRRHRLRNTMLGVQCFICLIFVLSVATVTMQILQDAKIFQLVTNTKNAERIFEMPFNTEIELEENKDEIMQYIHRSDWHELTAFQSSWYTSYINKEDWRQIKLFYVTSDYFQIMNYPISGNEEKELFCYVNSTLKEQLDRDSLDGFTIDNVYYSLTGVIDYQEFNNPPVAFVSFPEDKKADNVFVQVRQGKDVKEIHRKLTEKMQSYLPQGVSYKMQVLKDLSTIPKGMWTSIGIVVSCGIVCILITVLGMYGAISLDTEQRKKEVAIRKINGARVKDIYWLFGRLYVWIFAISALLSCSIVLAYFLNLPSLQAVGVFNYKNLWYWLVSLLFVAAIIACTIGYRLYKISRLNPADVIKSE